MKSLSFRRFVLCLLAAGCGGDEGPACEDPTYGDGVCNIDTTCDVVDVDCLIPFETPEAARTWYETSPAAASKGPSLPVTDSRFAPTQALLDEGWATYTSIYDVGDLAGERVQLVLIDDMAVNAFVSADLDRVRAGLAVMVNTGVVDKNAPKEQLVGLIIHELQHAIGLHVNKDVKDRIRAYYTAPVGMEPMGNVQTDNSAVRTQFEAWEKYAMIAGWASDVELSGLPMMGSKTSISSLGVLGPFFLDLINERRLANPTPACIASYTDFIALTNRLRGMKRELDQSFAIASTETAGIIAATTKLRDDCFMGVAGDAIVHLARLAGVTEAEVRVDLPADIIAAIEGKTVITGWFNAVNTSRTRMREIEAGFQAQAGVPWTRLRYFSTEEDADDVSARIMKQMKLAPDGMAQLLISVNPSLASDCTPLLGGGGDIPYGEQLMDDHHATCWRAGHQQAVGATTSSRLLPTWRPLGPARQVPGLLRLLGPNEDLEVGHVHAP